MQVFNINQRRGKANMYVYPWGHELTSTFCQSYIFPTRLGERDWSILKKNLDIVYIPP